MMMNVIITMVHGTFARGAAWTKPDSGLSLAISKSLQASGFNVDIRSHAWTGKNSFGDRDKAAKALRHEILLNGDDRKSLQFVIAHSHGGNIALEAVRPLGKDHGLAGLVTLSTPFLSCERSAFKWLLSLSLAAAALLVVTPLLYLLNTGGFWAMDFLDTLRGTFPLSWLIVPGVQGWLLLTIALAAIQLPVQWTAVAWAHAWAWASDRQEQEFARLERKVAGELPMLCLRFRADEALWLLRLSKYVVKPFRSIAIALAFLAGAAVAVSLAVAAVSFIMVNVAILARLFGVDATGFFNAAVAVTSWLSWWTGAGLLLAIPAVLCGLVWFVFGQIVLGTVLGIWSSPLSQMLVDFKITGRPDGAAATEITRFSIGTPTTPRHSLSYADPRAVADIAEWIAVRAKAMPRAGTSMRRSGAQHAR